MKILFIIDSLKYGGAERQFVELLKGVSIIKGIEAHVAYFENSDEGFNNELSKLNIPIKLFQRKRKYDLLLFKKLHRYVSDNNILLLHSFSVLPGLVAVLYSKISGLPVIASTIRNSKDINFYSFLSIRIQSQLANRFVSNSRAGFTARFKEMKSNFRVIYNGINFDRFKVNEAETRGVRNRYSLNNFDYVVSMIASLTNKKDHDTLLNAMYFVIRSEPKVLLLIVGDGPERPRLEKRVHDISLTQNVIFTGYLHNIYGVLANTHISVLLTNPKKAVEGIPNCLLESMAMGVPVIASRGGGTNEVIESGVNGILIDPQNKKQVASWISKILGDYDLQKRLGGMGKEFIATKFGYKRYINEYVTLYKELLFIN